MSEDPLLNIRYDAPRTSVKVLAVPVRSGEPGAELVPLGHPGESGWLDGAADGLAAEVVGYLAEAEHTGASGVVHTLPRPGRTPGRVLVVGVGDGDESGWRGYGAGAVRAARRESAVTLAVPVEAHPAVRGAAEGAWLAGYRFRMGADDPASAPRLRRVSLAGLAEPAAAANALAQARTFASCTILARDLTNTPSLDKSPAWLVDRFSRAIAGQPGIKVTVFGPEELAAGGFGGILAVGSGSDRPPQLLQLDWRPRGARRHVVLVGKGITFDSGGISIKPRDAMKLMRKDMAGAAAVGAALLGAAQLALPVRVTALLPLAENMVSGTAVRPGDVIRQYGGRTCEVLNTDAEGRLVLADALAYAAARLRPDLVVDLATLTGAAMVALGKRTAAVYSHDDELAGSLIEAGRRSGELIWRMPLAEEYVSALRSDIADVNNYPMPGEGGSVAAALFLREFTGSLRTRWAHLDMSSPAWSDAHERELTKGATGWGVRTLLRWLTDLAEQ
jgi:leucyl aminopeptidase